MLITMIVMLMYILGAAIFLISALGFATSSSLWKGLVK